MENLVYKNPFGEMVTDSLILSRISAKRHSDMLRTIRKCRRIVTGNHVFYFEESTYMDGNKHKQPRIILNREAAALVFSFMSGDKARACAEVISAFENEHERYRMPQLRTTKEAIMGMTEAIAKMSDEMSKHRVASNEHSQGLQNRMDILEQKVGTILKNTAVKHGLFYRLIRS